MTVLSRKMSSIPVLILEQSYSYKDFGSWWFSYNKDGKNYRVVFDGRDNILRVDTQDGKDWITEGEIQIQSETEMIKNVLTLIKEH